MNLYDTFLPFPPCMYPPVGEVVYLYALPSTLNGHIQSWSLGIFVVVNADRAKFNEEPELDSNNTLPEELALNALASYSTSHVSSVRLAANNLLSLDSITSGINV